MAPIMALIPNIFKATSMSLLFVSTAAKLRSLDSKRSWASLPTKTPFRCGCYLNLHQMDKHMELFKLSVVLKAPIDDLFPAEMRKQRDKLRTKAGSGG